MDLRLGLERFAIFIFTILLYRQTIGNGWLTQSSQPCVGLYLGSATV